MVERITVLLALLYCAGCAAASDGAGFEVTGEWSADERADLDAAAARLAAFTGRSVDLTGGDRRVAPMALPAGTVGHAFADTRTVAVDRAQLAATCAATPDPSACRQAIFAHELGHAVGLVHLPAGEHGIMSDGHLMAYDFTGADRAMCKREGVCE